MARIKFLKTIIDQAARNGFNFQHWYATATGLPWESEKQALDHLATGRNYFTLLFSHEFACSFWKQGTRVTFMVPSSTYTMRDKKGTLVEVKRKSHTRRRLKPDAWKYHLREMSCADEPLRYVRRFVLMAHEPTDAHANGRPAHRSAVPAKSHAQK
jgi:hypothetical protein